MKPSYKAFPLVLFVVLSLFSFADNELFGHGGRFKGPVTKSGTDDNPLDGVSQAAKQKGFSFPGGGPQVAFREESWEFWWDYNSDPLINLKPALLKLTPQAGVIDFPYEKITPKKRTNLVRFFTNIIRTESDPGIREAAVISLARTHDDSALSYLYHTYENDHNLYVKTVAVLAMGISENLNAVPILKSIFEDENEDTEIRAFAAVAAGLVGTDEAAKAFKEWFEPKRFKNLHRFLQQAIAFGAGLTEDSTLASSLRTALIKKLSDDRITNAYLIISLGRVGDRAANAVLIQCLDSKFTQIRRSAVIALGAAATPSDRDVVEGLVSKVSNDADNMVRNFAYLSLGKIGGDQAEAFLTKELNRANRASLPFVALAVGLIGNRAHGTLLLDLFRSKNDTSSRSALAVSMGLLGYDDALGELRKAVDSKMEPIYRGYCALALGMMRDSDSLDRLARTFKESNDVELHRFSAIALGLIGDRTITGEMYALLRAENPSITRISTAYNLGLIGDQNAIEPLLEIASNKKETDRMRSYAVLGLGLISDQGPTPVISKVTRNSNYTILDNFMYELFNIN